MKSLQYYWQTPFYVVFILTTLGLNNIAYGQQITNQTYNSTQQQYTISLDIREIPELKDHYLQLFNSRYEYSNALNEGNGIFAKKKLIVKFSPSYYHE